MPSSPPTHTAQHKSKPLWSSCPCYWVLCQWLLIADLSRDEATYIIFTWVSLNVLAVILHILCKYIQDELRWPGAVWFFFLKKTHLQRVRLLLSLGWQWHTNTTARRLHVPWENTIGRGWRSDIIASKRWQEPCASACTRWLWCLGDDTQHCWPQIDCIHKARSPKQNGFVYREETFSIESWQPGPTRTSNSLQSLDKKQALSALWPAQSRPAGQVLSSPVRGL